MKGKEKTILNFTLNEKMSNVFEKLGGVDAMAQWASKYPTEFYKMYVRVLDASAKTTDGKSEGVVIEGKAKDL